MQLIPKSFKILVAFVLITSFFFTVDNVHFGNRVEAATLYKWEKYSLYGTQIEEGYWDQHRTCVNSEERQGTGGSYWVCTKYEYGEMYWVHTGWRTEYSKGQFLENVTNANQNFYPRDGISGSYWYVFAGVANSDPTLSLATLNNQTLSEVAGYNNLAITGTVKDPDSGDTLTVKYTIDSNATHTNQVVQTLTANGTDQAFSKNVTINSSIPAGTHTLRVWAEDNKGGRSADVTRIFTVDKTGPTAPTLTLNPNTWTKGNVTFNITGGSDPSGIARYEYKVGAGAWTSGSSGTDTTEGTTAIQARAVDNVGNIGTPTSVQNAYIDKTAPTINLFASPTTPTNQDVTVTTTISDDLSGVSVKKWASGNQSASYFGSNGTTLSGNTFMVSTNGTYTVYAKDNAGNESINTIEISNIDKVPPTLLSASLSTTNNNPLWAKVDDVISIIFSSSKPLGELPEVITAGKAADVILVDENTYEATYKMTEDEAEGLITFSIDYVDTVGNIGDQVTNTTDDSSVTFDKTPPAAPILSNEIIEEDQIVISWTTIDDAEFYELRNENNVIYSGSDTSFTHLGLNPFTEYSYTITAIDAAGNVSDEGTISIKTLKPFPAKPTVTDYVYTNNSVTLRWVTADWAESYIVMNGEAVLYEGTDLIFIENGLSPKTSYSFSVIAKNIRGESDPYTIEFTTNPDHPAQPNLVAVPSENEIILSWNLVEDAELYELIYDGAIIYSGTETSFIHTDLVPNTSYEYTLIAKNITGESPYEIKSFSTLLPLPEKVSITATVSEASASIKWQPVQWADVYQLKRDGEIIYEGTDFDYLDHNLQPGTIYIFELAAINTSGVGQIDVLEIITLPSVVSNARIEEITDTSFIVVWDEVYGASGYVLTFSRGNIDTIMDTKMQYDLLEPGTLYGLTIYAQNDSGSGALVTIEVTTMKRPSSIVVKPNNLKLYKGNATTLQAIAVYPDLTEEDVTHKAQWATDNAQIAVVNDGSVIGVDYGNTNIHAEYFISGSAMVEVVEKVIYSPDPVDDSIIREPKDPQESNLVQKPEPAADEGDESEESDDVIPEEPSRTDKNEIDQGNPTSPVSSYSPKPSSSKPEIKLANRPSTKELDVEGIEPIPETIILLKNNLSKDLKANIPKFGIVNGTIKDGNGNPFENLKIELHSTPRITFTDALGYFEFRDVEPGNHTLYFADPSIFENADINFIVIEDDKGNKIVIDQDEVRSSMLNGGKIKLANFTISDIEPFYELGISTSISPNSKSSFGFFMNIFSSPFTFYTTLIIAVMVLLYMLAQLRRYVVVYDANDTFIRKRFVRASSSYLDLKLDRELDLSSGKDLKIMFPRSLSGKQVTFMDRGEIIHVEKLPVFDKPFPVYIENKGK